MCVCVYMCVHTCACMCVRVCVCVYVHAYSHADMAKHKAAVNDEVCNSCAL